MKRLVIGVLAVLAVSAVSSGFTQEEVDLVISVRTIDKERNHRPEIDT